MRSLRVNISYTILRRK